MHAQNSCIFHSHLSIGATPTQQTHCHQHFHLADNSYLEKNHDVTPHCHGCLKLAHMHAENSRVLRMPQRLACRQVPRKTHRHQHGNFADRLEKSRRNVTPHCHRCRLFEEGDAHDLCECQSPVIQVDTNQQGLCYAAVEDVCEDEWPGLGGNKTNANTRLNNKIKVTEDNNGE